MGKLIILICIVLFALKLGILIKNESSVSLVKDCKVLELQQQPIILGSDGNVKTEIRYLIVTDKETFICESSVLNGKFNNSDIFWRLKKGNTYDLKVAGIGKSMVSDYRNIINIESR